MKEGKKEIADERFELRSNIKRIRTGSNSVVNKKFVNLFVLVSTLLAIGYSVYYLETISSQKGNATQSENTTHSSSELSSVDKKSNQSSAPNIRINFQNNTNFESSTP